MQRCVCIKIKPDAAQVARLVALQGHFAAVCAVVAGIAQPQKIKDRYELHEAAYYAARQKTDAAAQVAVLAIKQVAACYRTLAKSGQLSADKPWPTLEFSPKGAVPFDARTYRIAGEGFSLYTLSGRIKVPWQLGARQKAMLRQGLAKEARLVHKRGRWYMHIAIRQNKPTAAPGTGVLGVDVGEVNIAATSSGKVFRAHKMKHDRDVFLSRRSRLQRHGSQSAMQALRKASGRQARYIRHTNHVVSKQIVAEAVSRGAATLSLEDLTHIGDRLKAGRRVRARLRKWPWRQLQNFVAYKAESAGLAVVYIDPAYTSQTCGVCLCLGRRNRSHFTCSCGSQRHADVNAASNIRRLALSIGGATPYVSAGHVALSPMGLLVGHKSSAL